MVDLSVSEHDGELVVDSRLIAPRLEIEHINFLETIEAYKTQAEQAFGIIRFETEKTGKRGRPQKYALLTENQAIFFMTLSRNTEAVVQCKIDLVLAFSRAKELLKRCQPRPEYVPYWYQRIKLALSDSTNPLQWGYFCIYQEIMGFFAELETRLEYLVADFNPVTGEYLVPDISIGLGFNKFLRLEDEIASEARKYFLGSSEPVDFRQPGMRKTGWFAGGKHHQEIILYNHVYPKVSHGDYQVQPASSYPERYLMIFRYYLQEYWVPDKCIPYLLERDPKGLSQVKNQFLRLSPIERKALKNTMIGKILPQLISLPESA